MIIYTPLNNVDKIFNTNFVVCVDGGSLIFV